MSRGWTVSHPHFIWRLWSSWGVLFQFIDLGGVMAMSSSQELDMDCKPDPSQMQTSPGSLSMGNSTLTLLPSSASAIPNTLTTATLASFNHSSVTSTAMSSFPNSSPTTVTVLTGAQGAPKTIVVVPVSSSGSGDPPTPKKIKTMWTHKGMLLIPCLAETIGWHWKTGDELTTRPTGC